MSMADTEVQTNGEVDQDPTQPPQLENDVEESMEVQTVQPTNTSETPDVEPTQQSTIPYDDFKLFVGGLSSDTTKSTIEDYFSKYGTVNEVNLKIDEITKKSRCFAFIVFKESDAVDRVIKDKPHKLDGKEIDSKKAIPHEIHQQLKNRTKKIFVGGVPTTMSSDTIKAYFEKFGPIEEVALVTDKGEERKRRGFCFVTFMSEDVADDVCANTFHDIDSAKVEVKRATPREQDNKRNEPAHFGRGGGRGHPHFYPHGGRGGGGISAHLAPYGGHAAYYSYYPPPAGYPAGGYMGGYGNYGGGYGGYAAYEPPFGGRREDSGYNSRYGPMRSYAHHGHNHGHGGSFHPYSR